MFITKTKTLLAAALLTGMIAVQAFGQQGHEEEKPKNLKVLPKNISGDELHTVMKTWSKSLGVRCSYCHVGQPGTPPKMDFASDEKPEKETARKMYKMVNAINKKYIGKMANGSFEKVTCVTCHMGRPTPIVSIDSLKTK